MICKLCQGYYNKNAVHEEEYASLEKLIMSILLWKKGESWKKKWNKCYKLTRRICKACVLCLVGDLYKLCEERLTNE